MQSDKQNFSFRNVQYSDEAQAYREYGLLVRNCAPGLGRYAGPARSDLHPRTGGFENQVQDEPSI